MYLNQILSQETLVPSPYTRLPVDGFLLIVGYLPQNFHLSIWKLLSCFKGVRDSYPVTNFLIVGHLQNVTSKQRLFKSFRAWVYFLTEHTVFCYMQTAFL